VCACIFCVFCVFIGWKRLQSARQKLRNNCLSSMYGGPASGRADWVIVAISHARICGMRTAVAERLKCTYGLHAFQKFYSLSAFRTLSLGFQGNSGILICAIFSPNDYHPIYMTDTHTDTHIPSRMHMCASLLIRSEDSIGLLQFLTKRFLLAVPPHTYIHTYIHTYTHMKHLGRVHFYSKWMLCRRTTHRVTHGFAKLLF
jgi:hypothetical protein